MMLIASQNASRISDGLSLSIMRPPNRSNTREQPDHSTSLNSVTVEDRRELLQPRTTRMPRHFFAPDSAIDEAQSSCRAEPQAVALQHGTAINTPRVQERKIASRRDGPRLVAAMCHHLSSSAAVARKANPQNVERRGTRDGPPHCADQNIARHHRRVRSGRMPFKSQAQRRKFAQLLVEGKISNKTFEEWNRETGAKKLPERVKRKAAGRKRKSAARAGSRRARVARH
jgi:hypothetical protein